MPRLYVPAEQRTVLAYRGTSSVSLHCYAQLPTITEGQPHYDHVQFAGSCLSEAFMLPGCQHSKDATMKTRHANIIQHCSTRLQDTGVKSLER